MKYSLLAAIAYALVAGGITQGFAPTGRTRNKQLGMLQRRSSLVVLANSPKSDDESKTTTGGNGNGNSILPELLLFNSKSRSKEALKTIEPKKVSMYTCGPTVYDYAHVGNFRAFLTYDLVKRVLLYFGYEVTHICNLTDVDDKIINRANEKGIENISELTRTFENYFFVIYLAEKITMHKKYVY